MRFSLYVGQFLFPLRAIDCACRCCIAVAFSPAVIGRVVGCNERLEAHEWCCQAATILDAVVVPAVLSEVIAQP